MEITLAKTAGFCFGVDRAVELARKTAKDKKSVKTIGPIIHNKILVEKLKTEGVGLLENLEDYKKDDTLVIRSHGVPGSVYDFLGENEIDYVDATCPFVSKLHRIVEEVDEDGGVIIAGDKDHPEVQGIMGHCVGHVEVVSEVEDFEKFDFSHKNHLLMVAQTTFNKEKWNKLKIIANKRYTKLEIFDTICSATDKRQEECKSLAKVSSIMLVVGDEKSSNTCKLYDICKKFTTAYLISDASEINIDYFTTSDKVGITAGASTPAFIIKEVIYKMSDIAKQIDTENEEFNFEEALEASFQTVHNNKKVVGTIVAVLPNEIQVDIGTKHTGYVSASEISTDPNVKPEELYKKGDEIELVVIKVNDAEGTVMLSKRRLEAQKGMEEINEAADNGTVLDGKVIEIIKGGVVVLAKGAKIFIPASQATMSRNDSLDELMGKEVQFKIIEKGRGRRRHVGSIRAIAMEARNAARDKFWESAEVGVKYTGTVKSLTSYGAFVDIGGVDGMIHVSELSWKRIKHPSEIVNIGDSVEVYIKDLDAENKKISLGYKKAEDNPWAMFKSKYGVGDVVDGKVVSVVAFGAFVNILDGVDGLVHISQIANQRIDKVSSVLTKGMDVQAKIMEIDDEKKCISLSIRELLEDDADVEATDAE